MFFRVYKCFSKENLVFYTENKFALGFSEISNNFQTPPNKKQGIETKNEGCLHFNPLSIVLQFPLQTPLQNETCHLCM